MQIDCRQKGFFLSVYDKPDPIKNRLAVSADFAAGATFIVKGLRIQRFGFFSVPGDNCL